MTRISSLLLATGLAIMPITAFAQPNPAPSVAPAAQPSTTTTTAKPAAPAAQMTKTDAKAPAVKTPVATKDTQGTHAKLGTTRPAAPAKTAEPSKS